MDEEKLAQMRATLNKLEDIRNSQLSIIDKINHVITDMFAHPDKELEKAMETAHQNSSDSVDLISEAIEEFEMKINKSESEG